MITKSVIKLLLANTALRDIVGSRIRPNVIKPDEVFPAMHVSSYNMEKLSCDADSGVRKGVIEIGIHADQYETCATITSLVRTILDDFSGMVGNVGISIQRGEETPDDYDETGVLNIKVIEYQAYAQIK